MYKLAVTLLFVLFTITGFAQIRVFLKKDLKPTTDSENAAYYKITTKEGDKYKIEEHYIDGPMYMTGYSSAPDTLIKDGYFTYFDKKGRKTDEGPYNNDRLTGRHIKYYSDTNVVHCTCDYSDNGDYKLESYYIDGKLKRKEAQNKNEKKTGTCYDRDGNKIDFTPFLVMPSPEVPLGEYLSEQIKYPENARKLNVEGRVIVRFYVDKDGSIVQAEVVQSVNMELDLEALRVVKSMPKWNPGKEDDEPMKVYYTLPIKFQLK